MSWTRHWTYPFAIELLANHDRPAIRVGRLAIDLRFQGKGLGLLADAAARGLRAEAAAFAMLVDAKAAVAFYEHHGFERLASQPRSLFLALATAGKALSTGRGQKKL